MPATLVLQQRGINQPQDEKGDVMSAPDTNIDKQEKRHRPSLLGIGVAVAVGLLMLAAVVGTGMGSIDDAGPTTVPAPVADQ